jgi:hypothetical protein
LSLPSDSVFSVSTSVCVLGFCSCLWWKLGINFFNEKLAFCCQNKLGVNNKK